MNKGMNIIIVTMVNNSGELKHNSQVVSTCDIILARDMRTCKSNMQTRENFLKYSTSVTVAPSSKNETTKSGFI